MRVSSSYGPLRDAPVTNRRDVTGPPSAEAPNASFRRPISSRDMSESSPAQTDDRHSNVTVPARSDTGLASLAAGPASAGQASCTRASVVAGASSRLSEPRTAESGRGAGRLTRPAPSPAGRT
jgi:hypothetical protein